MNIFSFIIIVTLASDYLLNIIANVLNIQALKLEIPTALTGVYKPDEYRRSQVYTRSQTRFGYVTSSFNLLITILFWFTGGFNLLDQFVRSWGFGTIINGLLYIGILFIVYSILTVPFGIYGTFIIEGKFGFNRTTPRIFITDILKSLVLMVVLGGSLLAGILVLFEYVEAYAWLYCWLVVTIFTIVMQVVVPKWIMPLFNKFTPMEPGELKNAIQEYAYSVGYEVGTIFVMDGSKRSGKTNAFFTGFGRTKRIALFDTLIDKHTTKEIVAILAHEIGHYKKKHVIQGTVMSIVHTGLIFFLLSVFLGSPGLYEAFFMEQVSIYAGLLFFGLLYTPIEMILSVALQVLSRRNEYEADRFTVETTDDSVNFVDALKKLSAENLSNLTPHPLYVFLNYSHPPLLQRINVINSYKNK